MSQRVSEKVPNVPSKFDHMKLLIKLTDNFIERLLLYLNLCEHLSCHLLYYKDVESLNHAHFHNFYKWPSQTDSNRQEAIEPWSNTSDNHNSVTWVQT